MSLLGLLFAAQLAAAVVPPPSADRAILDSFRAACARANRLENMQADVAAAGWQEMVPEADPRIDRLIRLGREAAGADGRVSGGPYQRTIAGRPLFLIVSRFEDAEGRWGNGCRLYDIGAAAPVPALVAEAWMSRPPTGSDDFGPAGSRRTWEPGWGNGVTVEISHVPAGSMLVERLGFSGNIYIAQAIGGF